MTTDLSRVILSYEIADTLNIATVITRNTAQSGSGFEKKVIRRDDKETAKGRETE